MHSKDHCRGAGQREGLLEGGFWNAPCVLPPRTPNGNDLCVLLVRSSQACYMAGHPLTAGSGVLRAIFRRQQPKREMTSQLKVGHSQRCPKHHMGAAAGDRFCDV